MLIAVSILPWYSEALDPDHPATLVIEKEIPSGSSLRELLHGLADQYPKFKEVIYDPQGDVLQPSVVITHNGRLVANSIARELPLTGGDQISLIPVYTGG